MEVVACGRAIAGHEIAIVDDDGRALADRRVGEIVFRGPSVAAGYHDHPEATAAVFTDGGLRTGDDGYLDNGVLYVTGRKKDLIVIHGRNCDPQTIEWVAADVPGLRKGNIVAFARPGADTEQIVIAAETRLAATAALADQIRRRVQAELLLPVAEVVLVKPGTLPKTSSGKLQRAKTRAQYEAGTLGRGGHRPTGGPGRSLELAKLAMLAWTSRTRYRLKRAIRRIT